MQFWTFEAAREFIQRKPEKRTASEKRTYRDVAAHIIRTTCWATDHYKQHFAKNKLTIGLVGTQDSHHDE